MSRSPIRQLVHSTTPLHNTAPAARVRVPTLHHPGCPGGMPTEHPCSCPSRWGSQPQQNDTAAPTRVTGDDRRSQEIAVACKGLRNRMRGKNEQFWKRIELPGDADDPCVLELERGQNVPTRTPPTHRVRTKLCTMTVTSEVRKRTQTTSSMCSMMRINWRRHLPQNEELDHGLDQPIAHRGII